MKKFSKTKTFSFIKDGLRIKKKALISKELFDFFFLKYEEYYILKIPEVDAKNILFEIRIDSFKYYILKTSGQEEATLDIKEKIKKILNIKFSRVYKIIFISPSENDWAVPII